MNMKEIFKPDWKKILVTIVIFLAFIFLPILPIKACNENVPPGEIVYCVTELKSILYYSESVIGGYEMYLMLAFIIISFVLSNLVMIGYNKIKRLK